MRRNIIDLTYDSDSDTNTEPDNTIYYRQKKARNAPEEDHPLNGILNPATGYAVIPYPDEIRDKFNVIQFLREQKEFTSSDENQLFVLGGFQALGNPSSYHHPLRRELMQAIYDYMGPLFASIMSHSNFSDYKYFSMIPDRFGIRRNDQQVSAETWHKDQSLDMERARNAIVFGGWINLDPVGSGKMQYFNCVPGEVVPPNQTEAYYTANVNRKGGFSAEQEAVPQLNARRQRIPVPPGHLVVFNELLTHEVAPGVKKSAFNPALTSYRLYLKWFLSKNNRPYWKQSRLDNFFDKQTQIGMSVHQPDAPFYASAHFSTSTEPLKQISLGIIAPLRTFSIGGNNPATNLAQRYMGQGNATKPSEDLPRTGLVDWDLAFPPYTNEEKRIYEPRLLY